MDETKEKIISITGTILFHILLILFLVFYYIKPTSAQRWSEELEGVPVMFGNVADAGGDDEAFGRGNSGDKAVAPIEETPSEVPAAAAAAAQTQETTAPKVNNNAVVTQDNEETIAIKKADKAAEDRKKQEAIKADRERKEKAETARLAAIEDQKKKAISSEIAGAFGNGSGSGSRGNTSGSGTQGVPTGNASYGKTSGVGGWGSYDLGGRGVRGDLIKPKYNDNDYGTVVIDVIVDPQGNVVSADIGRGTNTPSTTLKNEALRAAKKTKFSTAGKPGNQKGTISYRFNLN